MPYTMCSPSDDQIGFSFVRAVGREASEHPPRHVERPDVRVAVHGPVIDDPATIGRQRRAERVVAVWSAEPLNFTPRPIEPDEAALCRRNACPVRKGSRIRRRDRRNPYHGIDGDAFRDDSRIATQ
jgi:hypothetical protein